MDKHVLLRHFLSLGNEPLLERLDFLDELVGLNIRRLKLSPSVDVEGLAEFILQELSLLLLLEQLLLKQVDFASQVRETVGLILRVLDLTLELSDLLHKFENVISLLLVVDASLAESTLLNLNLLVQEQEFLVTLDELGAQNITLVDDHFVVLALLLLLRFSLSNDILESRNVALLGLYHLVTGINLLLDVFLILLQDVVLLPDSLLLLVVSLVLFVLSGDLFFQLTQLLREELVLHLQFSNLVLGFQKILGE